MSKRIASKFLLRRASPKTLLPLWSMAFGDALISNKTFKVSKRWNLDFTSSRLRRSSRWQAVSPCSLQLPGSAQSFKQRWVLVKSPSAAAKRSSLLGFRRLATTSKDWLTVKPRHSPCEESMRVERYCQNKMFVSSWFKLQLQHATTCYDYRSMTVFSVAESYSHIHTNLYTQPASSKVENVFCSSSSPTCSANKHTKRDNDSVGSTRSRRNASIIGVKPSTLRA